MKTEHEKLKEICDKIGYEINAELFYWDETDFRRQWNMYDEYDFVADVREIIFTQEFMSKFEDYYIKDKEYMWWKHLILHNLNNPTEYLYNLIKE